MKLKIISEEDGRVEMHFGGEGHTLLNLLQSTLLVNKDVNMAGYAKPHPLEDRSVLYVYMKKGKKHKRAFTKATKDARKQVEDFIKKFEAQVAKKRS
ncbi:MAG: hypothetical protein JSV18_02585 [Candidatus Bathyarchaeota archaeon]|nr:MAG: hypothetical protein JSV18_02585 [Candidatus Bathyarchaeota archaeon]